MVVFEIEDLRTYYTTPLGFNKALDGVSFSLGEGEIFGIAGESGCGKSTLALTLMRLLPPSATIEGGRALLGGVDLIKASEIQLSSLRWKKIAIIFQTAMNALNPVMRIEKQIAEAIVLHDKQNLPEALNSARKLLGRVGIDESRGREYPHQFSGGMRQRAMIAMALACGPSVLIADEPTTALDVIVQAQILELLGALGKEESLSIILITHDLAVIAKLCERVGIMYAGKMVEIGDRESIFKEPRHPYTQALVKCIPRLRANAQSLVLVSGEPPNLINAGPGCRFIERCPFAREECKQDPPDVKLSDRSRVLCVLYKDGLNAVGNYSD